MDFHVLTLFPEMVENTVQTSITGRAVKNGKISLHTVNIRDFADNKHSRVDDYPYGGGAGMVIQAEPVYQAYQSVKKRTSKPRCIYLTPQGKVFNQTMAEEFALEEELVFLCGHYEGIDERVLEEIVTDYVSIGDYVLTGGELAACVMIDAISRFVPGVLNNEESSQFESMQDNLLEYPHYTRPESWRGKNVPAVLLTGDHTKIEAWRLEESYKRTKERRPDLRAKNRPVTAGCIGTLCGGQSLCHKTYRTGIWKICDGDGEGTARQRDRSRRDGTDRNGDAGDRERGRHGDKAGSCDRSRCAGGTQQPQAEPDDPDCRYRDPSGIRSRKSSEWTDAGDIGGSGDRDRCADRCGRGNDRQRYDGKSDSGDGNVRDIKRRGRSIKNV